MMATFKITNPCSAHYETHNRNENTCPEIGETFTFTNLADAFIQSDLHSSYTFVLSVHVFPGNRTHNLCAANAML